MQSTIHIAASKERIQSESDWRHWRIFVGDNVTEKPLKEIAFSKNGKKLPLTTGTSKKPDQFGQYVWFDANGTLTIENNVATVILNKDAEPLRIGVRTRALYETQEHMHWIVFELDQNEEHIVESVNFLFENDQLPIKTWSSKTPDNRDLRAALLINGTIEELQDKAVINLDGHTNPID